MASTMLLALAVLFTATAVNGLTCYNCDSKNNALCSYGFTSLTYASQECSSAGFIDNIISPKCYKITAEGKDGSSYIARGCLPPATVGCSAMAKAIGWISNADSQDGLRNLQCDTCETDKCNSATRMTGFTIVGLVISSFLFMF
ncbi:unnamed protein product [Acanthoscelides obtectus]|uniref:Protein sleepless n=1 Tax=Acanthoscelides obtectus TaxID=200917 RepID=A0A9P0JIQ6_ACAOB|nr:unnamed protein product [Acanthoscelides obtectus]CAK1639713.1 hypothetical protein AOBTE_LOCUS11327 [Acanthoscelides obtectus]